MSPGLQGQFQLQITAQFRNTSNNPITATLYIVIVSEGSMTIPGLNSCTRQLGIITKSDILNAMSKPGVSYDQIRESQYGGGGNFLSNLKDFGSKILRFLQGSKLISNVASAIPHPIAQTVGTVARNLGLGDSYRRGGVVIEPSLYHDYLGSGEGDYEDEPVGGRKLTRKDLKNRLKRM
jgi:hypothetical protein